MKEFNTGSEFSRSEEIFSTREFTPPREFSDTSEEVSLQVRETDPSSDRTDKKNRRNRSLLIQAAAAMAAAVILTSSMNVDLLREDFLFGDTIERLLTDAGAKKGIITISLLWNTEDDLDLHVELPNGEEVFYGNPQAGGGQLDVDQQVGSFVEHPVENIFFTTAEHGQYRVRLNNFSNRTEKDSEYLIRVTVKGKRKEYRGTIGNGWKTICTFRY